MGLDDYKKILLKDTAHYKKRGMIRTYKKLVSITKSSDIAISVMIRTLNYDLIDVKYMLNKIKYLQTKYLKTKSLDSLNIESNFIS